jgi:predicted enzyme related to lactoylglutathione lyase
VFVSVCASASTDPERSIKFYEDVFGFELRIKHGKWWSELSAGNTTLALHWVDNSAAKGEEGGAAASAAASKDGPASSSEKPSQAGVASPSFFVEDLDAFHSRVQSIPGLTVVKAPSKQPWGGAQASYKDPDGLTLSVTELKKMRTE